MSLISFLLMLVVAAAVVWGVLKVFAGQWKELIIGIIVLFVALWIFSALGVTLPNIPVMH